MPRAPKMIDCRRVWCSGASQISQISPANLPRLAASVCSRFVELASSSPSNANLMFDFVCSPAARIASSAARIAMIGALSSAAERA